MTMHIAGVGTSVPPRRVTQDDAARHAIDVWGAQAGRAATITALYRHSGVATRHSVLLEAPSNGTAARQSFYRQAVGLDDHGPSTGDRMQCYEAYALDLAAAAAARALDDAAISAADCTHLLTVSCRGFHAPGVDIGLMERLGLPSGIARAHIGFMGCHGALNALRLASAITSADPSARVLLSCVELCTLHQQYCCDVQQIVANALFSDGAAAVVGCGSEPDRRGWQVVDQRSILLPDTAEQMSWRIGDHGFVMTLSPLVPDVIRHRLRPWLEEWLATHGLAVESIPSWAIHPGGPKILAACGESLGLDPARLWASHEVLAEFGNMSSPTVLFILERLRQRQADVPCVMLAFGPGLTIEAALVGER
jgi:predicted naringenin-chalcone synthase